MAELVGERRRRPFLEASGEPGDLGRPKVLATIKSGHQPVGRFEDGRRRIAAPEHPRGEAPRLVRTGFSFPGFPNPKSAPDWTGIALAAPAASVLLAWAGFTIFAGLCRSCNRVAVHSRRRFGGLREQILERDGRLCQA